MGKNNDKQKIPSSASQYERLLKSILGESIDMVINKFSTKYDDVVVAYVDGLVNLDLVDRDIMRPLKSEMFNGDIERSINSVYEEVEDIALVVKAVLNGDAVVFYEGKSKAYVMDFKKYEMRNITTPESETVTRGPKEGFTENILTNTSLLRRKLRTTNLVIENIILGRQTNTIVCIVYLNDIVNRKILREVKKKVKQIDTDNILETGQIEQLIEENPYSLLPGIGMTQKPDILAARLLEGRIGIICDGTPHVLTIPELFIETLHTSEDFYTRTLYSNFMRLIRLFALLIAVLLPGVTVAIFTFSPEMMPFVFLRTVIATTKGTPLPIAAELFFLVVMFELLREAGVRLPKTVGSAITIVGALIIGDSAVQAGIVSSPSVIIVALTAVAGLLLPNLNEFTTLYKIIFLFLGSSMGLLGIGAGIIIMLVNIISTESFGIPILSSFNKEECKDSIIRAPLSQITFRPVSIVKRNIKRKYSKNGESND